MTSTDPLYLYDLLPKDVSNIILKQLQPNDLLNLSCLNKQYNEDFKETIQYIQKNKKRGYKMLKKNCLISI